MFPLLTIIVAIIVGLAYPDVVREQRPPDVFGVLAVVLGTGLAARFLFGAAVRQAARTGAAPGPILIRASQLLRGAMVCGFSLAVYAFHWPAVVHVLGIEGWVLVDELVVLAPFFTMLVLLHVAAHSAETGLDLHRGRLGAYLVFHLRQYLLPVLPILFYILIGDVVGVANRSGVRWVAELTIVIRAYPFALWLMLAVTLLLAWCAIPFLLRWVWKTTSMPPGPLRDRLEEFSRREGFKARDILVMPTGGNVMNAAVVGLAAPFRFVLLTDALIAGLEPDEVEAVFAHEVGHAKHRHMLLYFLFTLGFALLTFFLGSLAEDHLAAWIGDREYVYLLLTVGAFLLWFGIIFGFVSRRFEQQADVYGAMATSRVQGIGTDDPESHPFLRALSGLADQMGDIREVKGWRHFSLGERIAFLARFFESEEVRRRYRRGMTTLLLFFFGLLAALGVAAAATVPGQLRDGRMRASYARAQWLWEQGSYQEAVWERHRAEEFAREAGMNVLTPMDDAREYHELSQAQGLTPADRAVALAQLSAAYRGLGWSGAARDTLQDVLREFGDHPLFLTMLGEVLLDEGRRGGARLAFEDALALLPADHDSRGYVERRIREISADR